jgi:hypothetical protein
MRMHDHLRLRHVVRELVWLRGRCERRLSVGEYKDGYACQPEAEERVDRAKREMSCGAGVTPQDVSAKGNDDQGGDQQRDPAEDARRAPDRRRRNLRCRSRPARSSRGASPTELGRGRRPLRVLVRPKVRRGRRRTPRHRARRGQRLRFRRMRPRHLGPSRLRHPRLITAGPVRGRG